MFADHIHSEKSKYRTTQCCLPIVVRLRAHLRGRAGFQAISWQKVIIHGRAAHAGTTPPGHAAVYPCGIPHIIHGLQCDRDPWPIAAHHLGKRLAGPTAVGHRHHLGDHHEPGMIIDPGDQLAFPAVSQRDIADDVELPQVHRQLTLPALELSLVLLGLRIHQTVACHDPMHRRPSRNGTDALPAELVADPASTPAGMLAPPLAYQRFHIGRNPLQAVQRTARPIRQRPGDARILLYQHLRITSDRSTGGRCRRRPGENQVSEHRETAGQSGLGGDGDTRSRGGLALSGGSALTSSRAVILTSCLRLPDEASLPFVR